MLGKYLVIDNEQMPNPVSGSLQMMLNAIENVYTTEAGGQAANVVRLDRPSWTATFNCSSAKKDALLLKCQAASVNVTIAGQTMSGRLRLSGGVQLVQDTERTPETDGLWVVPVTFEGF